MLVARTSLAVIDSATLKVKVVVWMEAGKNEIDLVENGVMFVDKRGSFSRIDHR